jgi:gliding motility-associated-like protein
LWTLSATGTTSLCPNETGTINVSVSDNTTGSPEVYTYLLPDGTTSSETGNSLAITQTGTYTITVDILGCTNFINYTVTQSSANWIIVPTGPTSLCPNETGTITVDISNNINNYPEVYTYTLPNGSVSDDKDNSLEIVGGGTYQIEVDILGCKSFVDYTIQENNQEFLLDYQSGCNANNYTIEVKPKDNSFDLATSTFEWTDPNGQIISTESSCEATVIGLYTCIVSNSIGCTSVFSQPFTNIACEIQKGISPKGMGGDGKNDFFDLESLNVTKLSIFNRYGSKVYTKDNYSNEWFGQSDKGDELPDGTYYYVIELLNESSKTGWIYINREQ